MKGVDMDDKVWGAIDHAFKYVAIAIGAIAIASYSYEAALFLAKG
jgi:hypothetical protein